MSRKCVRFFYVVAAMFSFGIGQVISQVGLSAAVGNYRFPGFESGSNDFIENTVGSTVVAELGIFYWTRLKERRIEFLPELNFTRKLSGLDFNALQVYVNTRIYPLDFLNDCHCPTFSKQNDVFKKGFFVMISPGAGMYAFDEDDWKAIFSGKVGVGLDLGVSETVTISPILFHTWQSKGQWDNARLSDGGNPINMETRMGYFGGGIQALLRFDKKNW